MPIIVPVRLNRLTEPEFKAIDYQVMGHAFACHNKLGRLCDEKVYQNDLAARLTKAELVARTEQTVQVTFRNFVKSYFLDLIVNDSIVYELKAAAALTREHEAQLLNYLFLCDAPTGKLVNFRPASVESRSVNATVGWHEQRQTTIDLAYWQPHGDRDAILPGLLQGLADDWGVFLETNIYQDALVHCLGGEDVVYQEVPLSRDGIVLGTQRLPLISSDAAFRFTALTRETPGMESNLHRLLCLTPLWCLHWINFNRHTIELHTLLK